jgi:hypothetical protein
VAAPTPSDLDFSQCIQGSYDDAKGALRVEAQITAPIDVNGEVLVDIRATDGDSVLVYGTQNGLVGGILQVLKVNSDGSINAQITGSITGTVNANLNGLNAFQTSQYSIGTSAVQITPTPLVGRSSVGLKATTVGNNIIYIGNSPSVTTSTGYALFNGDAVQMDLTPSDTIYAISADVGQTLYILEIGS